MNERNERNNGEIDDFSMNSSWYVAFTKLKGNHYNVHNNNLPLVTTESNFLIDYDDD